MAAITVQSNLLPTGPNYSVAAYNTDSVPEAFGYSLASGDDVTETTPEQMAVLAAFDSLATAQIPVRVLSEVVAADGTTTLTFNVPVVLDPGTITNSSAKVNAASLTATGNTLVQTITRFLRRLSKLNRGAN